MGNETRHPGNEAGRTGGIVAAADAGVDSLAVAAARGVGGSAVYVGSDQFVVVGLGDRTFAVVAASLPYGGRAAISKQESGSGWQLLSRGWPRSDTEPTSVL